MNLPLLLLSLAIAFTMTACATRYQEGFDTACHHVGGKVVRSLQPEYAVCLNGAWRR